MNMNDSSKYSTQKHSHMPPTDHALVQKHVFSMPTYTTVGGKRIKDLKVGWESYGTLSEAKDNVILVPHHFSANSHVAGKYQESDVLPGYWDSIIGPGKAIDTDRFFVISIDSLVNMNSKDGITVTTGPASVDPDTGRPYALSFPVVTIRDFVRVQRALLDSLGIERLVASAGISMGALQSYEWAAAYPDMVERVIAVNGSPTQKPFGIAGLETWIGPIKIDQNWNKGDYYGGPEPIDGVTLALYNVTMNSLHPEYVGATFGSQWADQNRNPLDAMDNLFLSEYALKAFGVQRAIAAVDANHMLYMAKANQLFIAGTAGSSVDPDFKNIKAKTLVVHARSDLFFPIADAKTEVGQLKKNGTQAEFVELDSGGGHLSGITEIIKVADSIRNFLPS
jgi:homoserine O-acetyltransferase